MFLVWLLMLQKHIQKPITYISLFLLRLIRRALTPALIPHTAALLFVEAHCPFLAARAPDQMQWKLLLYFSAAGSAVIWETMWCCSPDRRDSFAHVVAMCHLYLLIPTQVPGGSQWWQAEAGTTPGSGAWMTNELYCLRFQWQSWQAPLQTNWVGVPFCGCLGLQPYLHLDKWFQYLQLSAEP